MSSRSEFLRDRLEAFLSRRSPPRLADTGRTVEAAALHRALERLAPDIGLEVWWPAFEDAVMARERSRGWPLVSELEIAAAALRAKAPPASIGASPPPSRSASRAFADAALWAERMERGEQVDESWIWGDRAAHLVSCGLASRTLLTSYQVGQVASTLDRFGAPGLEHLAARHGDEVWRAHDRLQHARGRRQGGDGGAP